MEQLKKINGTTLKTLKRQLESAGVDMATWGIGQAKTLAHLRKEIESGETILVANEAGGLLRKVVVGGADIFYKSPEGKRYRLKEDRQIFKDGRERRRNLGQAVSEKIKPGEDPEVAMIRGIQEELGIGSEITIIKIGAEERIIDSPSYPGLQSQYILHKFQAVLTKRQFNPAGYVEDQSDKSTYFMWEEIKED